VAISPDVSPQLTQSRNKQLQRAVRGKVPRHIGKRAATELRR
jgi:hypothetical protein